MTDEPREENRPEDEDVEAHSAPTIPTIPTIPTHSDEDEDVEAHSLGIPTIPT